MRQIGILLLILLSAILVACNPPESSAVKKCNTMCESDGRLTQLASKVMYKPIKLCQKYCAETQGTCQPGATTPNYNICVYYGVNAGSLAPARPGDFSNRILQSFER